MLHYLSYRQGGRGLKACDSVFGNPALKTTREIKAFFRSFKVDNREYKFDRDDAMNKTCAKPGWAPGLGHLPALPGFLIEFAH